MKVSDVLAWSSALPLWFAHGQQEYLRQREVRETLTSELWGATGKAWDPENSLLRDFTNVGYRLGNEPIPDWEVGVYLTDYGAIPDDDESDVEAFRRAMAACPPYKAILVPNGRYIIDERLDVSANNIVILPPRCVCRNPVGWIFHTLLATTNRLL